MRSAAKLRDIAGELGVHPSTVSRAIAGLPGVSDARRELILETARKLHYQPNALARSLRSGQQRVVGLVFPDVLNELYSTAATVLASMLASHGYLIHLSITYDHQAEERKALLSLVEHQVSGIIIAPCGPRDPVLSRALARTPIVEFMRDTDARVDKVLWDDENAAYMAAKHLLDFGHRSIRFITGVPEVRTTIARVAGFEHALREVGLRDEGWVRFGRSPADWKNAAQGLAYESPRSTAVIASNHLIALNILDALSAAEVAVPRDVSLVGLDDPSWFWTAHNGITGVNVPWTMMAERAGEFLVQGLSRGRGAQRRWKPTTVRFPARLVVRNSTAAPRTLNLPASLPQAFA